MAILCLIVQFVSPHDYVRLAERVLNIKTDSVLVVVVINSVLLDLSFISILLLQSIWQF